MKITSRKKKITIFDIVIYFIAAFLFLIVAYPLILVVSCSISDPGLVATGQVLFWPKGINMEGYKQLLNNPNILIGYGNTIFYTVFGTLVNLAVTIPAGYVLSKTMVPGTKLFTGLFMFTMYFSGGMIPTFLLVNKLGLYNTRAVLLILGAFSTYNCIICRSFFVGLPTELEEAARIDGCSPLGTFFKVVLPLSKALLGVMVLYFGVAHWNGYFNAMIYINEDVKQPLQVFLRRILVLAQISANMDEAGDYAAHLADMEALIRYAVIVVSSAPLLILYPFLQKYFDKGVLIGSVKG
ncbi:MAG: carbohydrate ABC transporter permease [Lachnospiraceae bacterium]|nr:carbohydrate ABC transporter permease [Lachnospiraceae bacterium]